MTRKIKKMRVKMKKKRKKNMVVVQALIHLGVEFTESTKNIKLRVKN